MKIEEVSSVQVRTVEADADVILVNGVPFFYKNTGNTRRVFVNKEKTLVVKVPITTLDQQYNDNEAQKWDEFSDEVRTQFAETKLLEGGYVVQEYLHTMDDPETENWLGRNMTMSEVRFALSCRNEVGYDANGVLKCYDYDEFKKY